jgi:hypothetical protein
MSASNKKKTIAEYIKKYYSEYGQGPSMKIIEKECDINPREFYQLFQNQEEAFKVAGIPYSDEARKTVEKANVARRKDVNQGWVTQRVRLISEEESYVHALISADESTYNQMIKRIDEKYFEDYKVRKKRLDDYYINLLQSNYDDKKDIHDAHNQLSLPNFFLPLFMSLTRLEKRYEYARSLILTDSSAKIPFVEEGFNFNDLEGSYKVLRKKIFDELLSKNRSWLFDEKAKDYFDKMYSYLAKVYW